MVMDRALEGSKVGQSSVALAPTPMVMRWSPPPMFLPLLPFSREEVGKSSPPARSSPYIGIVSADGRQSAPIRPEPVPTYQFPGGVGFRVVLEAIRGPSGAAIGEQLLDFKRDDPSARPLLQVSASRDLGNGSVRVCDQGEGGIPGISPPNFGPDQSIADALNDIG